MPYYWIFQGNPKAAWLEGKDFTEVIHSAEYLTWGANQNRKDMAVGDVVILWGSGPKSGAVAEFMIISKPFQEEGGWWIEMYKIRNYDPVFPRSEMIKVIPDHQLIKARMGTNMALKEDDYKKIMQAMNLSVIDEPYVDNLCKELDEKWAKENAERQAKEQAETPATEDNPKQ